MGAGGFVAKAWKGMIIGEQGGEGLHRGGGGGGRHGMWCNKGRLDVPMSIYFSYFGKPVQKLFIHLGLVHTTFYMICTTQLIYAEV